MHRIHVLTGILILAASSFAQQPQNPNPSPDTYTREPYTRPVERTSGGGNWGLLGLFGLSGLLGLRRRRTVGLDEYGTEPRRKVA